jgi:tripartite-type tricarboxylate transporter receptor subunit TctC
MIVSHRCRCSTSLAVAGVAATALGLAALGTPAKADPVEDFYRGKTIDLVIGFTPGGTYDLYARVVTQFMGDYIPGKPHIVPRTMAGGGSRIAAGYVAKVAPKDGTVIGTASQALSVGQALGDMSLQFDTTKLIYIGNPESDNNTTTTWTASGIKTIEDATKREVTIGSTGDTQSSQYPKVMNALLGTRFKIIIGYPGGNDIDLAMERGEVEGRGSNGWSGWKAVHPDWLRDNKISILVQIGLAKARDLPDVPLLVDFAKNDQDRAMLKLLSASTAIGMQLFTTPDVPPERVKALRDAFDATMKDPGFLEEIKKDKLDLNPVQGVEMQKIVADIIATPKPVIDRTNEIIGASAGSRP